MNYIREQETNLNNSTVCSYITLSPSVMSIYSVTLIKNSDRTNIVL